MPRKVLQCDGLGTESTVVPLQLKDDFDKLPNYRLEAGDVGNLTLVEPPSGMGGINSLAPQSHCHGDILQLLWRLHSEEWAHGVIRRRLQAEVRSVCLTSSRI